MDTDSDLNKSQSFLVHRRRLSSSFSSESGKGGEAVPHLMITDVAMHFDDIDYFDEQNQNYSESITMGEKITTYSTLDLWGLLMILAFAVPFLSVVFSYLIDGFLELSLNVFLSEDEKTFPNFVFALLVSLTMAFSACYLCSYNKDAEGSGIPELKATLASGLSFYKYFSLRVLAAKIIGLFFSVGSGLFIGREGPFVYISAAMAYNLSKFRWFRRLHSKKSFRKQILSTAGGIGLTATFGTPIGGCLYSIEILTTFFPVGAFWKTFFCSFICSVVFRGFGELVDLSFWAKTDFGSTGNLINLELLSFFILGVACGLLGALHVKVIENLLIYRKMIRSHQIFSRYLYTGLACLLNIFMVFYYWSYGFMIETSSDNLFNSQYPDATLDHWFKLLIFIILKLLCNALGVTCPLPTGIFIPLFFTGALFGRLYGIFSAEFLGYTTNIGRYSVVGAAALVSGVTHTLAMAIIGLELTRDMSLLFPMLTGVITAYYVSRAFTISVYYIIAELKELPFLPRTLKAEVYNRCVRDIMDLDFPFISVESSFGDLALVLNHIDYKTRTIPMINEETLELTGSVQSANMRSYLVKTGKKHIQGYHPKTATLRNKIPSKNFFSLLPNISEKNIPEDMKVLFNIELENEGFWERKIDIYDKDLGLDISPFTIQDNISVPRAHYLFSMLGLQTVFVLNRGKLVGMMSISNFQDIRYNEVHSEKVIKDYRKAESNILKPISEEDSGSALKRRKGSI